MTFLKEFWQFMMENKKWWMLPIVFMFILIGGLVLLTQGTAMAPFVYTLF